MNNYIIDPSKCALNNEVIIAVIFTLSGENDDRFDRQKWNIIKKYQKAVIHSMHKQQQLKDAQKVYRVCDIDYYEQNKELSMLQISINYTQKFGYEWFADKKQNEQIFMGFEITTSVGCEHHVSGCTVFCQLCNRYFGCRKCHDDQVESHTLERKEKLIRCSFCGQQQEIGLECMNCHEIMGNTTCDVCNYVIFTSYDAQPSYHCEKCDHCCIGLPEFTKHCDKCNQCVNLSKFDQHVCQKFKSCSICDNSLEEIVWFNLKCGHPIHQSCYNEQLSKKKFKCKLCKKFIPTGEDLIYFQKRIKQIFMNNFILPKYEHQILRVHCDECQNEFLQQYNTCHLYFCTFCNSFNATELNIPGEFSDFQRYLEEEKPEFQPLQPTLVEITKYLSKFTNQVQEMMMKMKQMMVNISEEEQIGVFCLFVNRNELTTEEQIIEKFKKFVGK